MGGADSRDIDAQCDTKERRTAGQGGAGQRPDCGEKFDRYFNTDREMLAADRYVGNMLEHMPPFLALLWLNAIFVGPRGATVGGAAYVACRVLYPLLMGRQLGRGIPSRILFATLVGYGVLMYFVVRLLVVVARLV